MSDPKRHHYVPAFYLAGFTVDRNRDASFSVYDREKNEFRTQTPDTSAHQRYYYATETPEGKRDFSVETFFSGFENAAKPLIDKLEQEGIITDDERATLALFFALLHTRVPQFERTSNEIYDAMQKALNRIRYRSPDDVRQAMDELEREQGIKIPATAESAFALLTGEELKFAAHRNETIATMIRMAIDVGGHLNQFMWHVIHATPNSQFLTIDAPVVVLPPPDWTGDCGYGFLTPGAMTFLPLTARCALFMENTAFGLDHRVMPEEGIHINNKGIVSHSERFVFARDKRYLERVVVESRLPEIPLRPSFV